MVMERKVFSDSWLMPTEANNVYQEVVFQHRRSRWGERLNIIGEQGQGRSNLHLPVLPTLGPAANLLSQDHLDSQRKGTLSLK
mmetsp:Transcript_49141/g.147934  ORF Transcript_49141/g.147934 Transcript_49141/m.147934 type:complete len:83 (-) Transcript_49141:211-459(-)